MMQAQEQLEKLMNRVSPHEIVRVLFSKSAAEAREFSRVVLLQVYFTFNQAIFLLTVIAIVLSITVSMQAGLGLSVIGATSRIGELWMWMVFRIFGPLLTAIIIIARSCTAVAVETAIMKYNREIEALELMGIPTVDYVFTPRIVAGALSNFCMTFFFMAVAFFGTWLSKNWFASMPISHLYDQITKAITFEDVVFFILKTVIVGAGIFWIACKMGLSLKRGSFEVPIIAMNAVVDGYIWTFVTHGFFTAVFIMIHGFHLL
jgi:phospholipid/cholesterol/gamma-HCH transport system permease protein